MIEQRDGSFGGSGWIDLWRCGNDSSAVDTEEFGACQSPESCAAGARFAADVGVVASNEVVACTSVDPVAGVLSVGNRMSADDVIVAAAAKDSVEALTTDDDVAARTCVDQIVAAKSLF